MTLEFCFGVLISLKRNVKFRPKVHWRKGFKN